ncbi:MAG: hypothetical protein GY841_10430 [FCB group bacterium]|nr:hypothetical protein [FCB group bacterium]
MAITAKLIAKIVAEDDTKKGTASAGRNFEGLEKSIKKAAAALLTIGAAKVAFDLGKLGAQAARTKNAFQNISGGADAAAANLAAMKTATRGAISEVDAMNAANKLMQMGLVNNATELGDFTEMATKLGTAMGRDVTSSIEEFSLMIANQSIPRLDTFGISASNVRTRMNELGEENKNLTREQKFNIAVQEEGQKAMEKLGDSVDDQLLAVERAEAQWADLKVELGTQVMPIVEFTAKAFGTLAGNATELTTKTAGVIEEYGILEGVTAFIIEGLLDTNDTINTLIDTMEEEAIAAEAMNRTFSDGGVHAETERIAIAQLTIATQDSAAAFETYAQNSATIITGNQDSAAAFDTYSAAIRASEEAANINAAAQRAQRDAIAEAAEKALTARDAFLDTASSIGEMSKAQFAQEQIKALGQAVEDETLSTEDYIAAKEALLVQFGLLTAAEAETQAQMDLLTASFIAGETSQKAYVVEAELAKTALDSGSTAAKLAEQKTAAYGDALDDTADSVVLYTGDLTTLGDTINALPDDKVINVKVNVSGGDVDVGTGGPSDDVVLPPDPAAGYASGGMVGTNSPVMVGERGPEMLVGARGARVVNHSRTASLTNNWGGITINTNAGLAQLQSNLRRDQLQGLRI